MHAILVSIGTDGDIFPYMGLGQRLRERGHSVTLVASGHYEAKVAAHGFGFRALISAEENHALLSNPDFWHPLKAVPLAAKWGLHFVDRQYRLLSELAAGAGAVFISNPAVFAAGLVHETSGRPHASLILQPWMILSSIAPPVMPMFDLNRWPRPLVRLFWRTLDGVGDWFVGRSLNRKRLRLGLKPVRRIFSHWLSRQRVLGLFPEWYGPVQADWPETIRLVGFPMFDGGQAAELPAEVESFCRAGKPPVAVTFGTEMMHAERVYHALINMTARLGLRCIVLTKYRGQLPAELPPSMLHSTFAPFQKLFPLCSAVVHHGGIGTTAKALAAGVPQLIVPFGFDQKDNAARVERLGAGLSVRFKPGRLAPIEAALKRVLEDGVTEGCQRVRQRFVDQPDALNAAADLIEELAAKSRQ
jgi:rhamnosyltransferase subunit B